MIRNAYISSAIPRSKESSSNIFGLLKVGRSWGTRAFRVTTDVLTIPSVSTLTERPSVDTGLETPVDALGSSHCLSCNERISLQS